MKSRRRADTPIPELLPAHDLRYGRCGCDNSPMKKSAMIWGCALVLLTVFGVAAAQTGAAAKSSKTPTAKPQSSSATNQRPASAAKTGSAATAHSSVTLTDQKSKVSYAIGLNIGKSMRRQAVDVDPNVLAQGLKDGLNDAKPLLTDDEVRATMTAFQTDMRAKQEEKMKEASASAKKEGEAFLAANKTKEGVVSLPSGLQYKVLTAGTGPKPAASDTVVCNYRGTLVNGTEFDASTKHGGPVTFPVSGVIKGWTEALQLMPVGSKWQLFIPADLAYGDQGAGADIPPGSTLIFEIELVSIKEKGK